MFRTAALLLTIVATGILCLAVIGCTLHYVQSTDGQVLDIQLMRPGPVQPASNSTE